MKAEQAAITVSGRGAAISSFERAAHLSELPVKPRRGQLQAFP